MNQRRKKKSQLGELPPKYKFFLNPYKDARFTQCPQCEQKMKVRKHPFFIHIAPEQPLVLNMSGKYCPTCDLLLLHQNKVEELLAAAMIGRNPDVIGNEYLILGTVTRKGWREAQKNRQGLKMIFRYLHEFKEYLTFKPRHYGWRPTEK